MKVREALLVGCAALACAFVLATAFIFLRSAAQGPWVRPSLRIQAGSVEGGDGGRVWVIEAGQATILARAVSTELGSGWIRDREPGFNAFFVEGAALVDATASNAKHRRFDGAVSANRLFVVAQTGATRVTGVAVHALWFAAIGAALGAWPMSVATTRWRRRRRGACVQCGYLRAGLATNAPCPECGASTPLHSLPR